MMLLGRMVSFATWQKFIEASSGSAAMKRRVIDLVRDRVREGELIGTVRPERTPEERFAGIAEARKVKIG